MNKKRSFCDGIARRDFLRVGATGATALSLPAILQSQASAADRDDVSFIFLFLKGGLSTIDSWDMKPDAPAEFRGEFNPIDTVVPGIQLCEHLPTLAKHTDLFSLVRSFGHSNSGHGPADHYMMTAYNPTAGFNANLSPNNQRPSHGSVISRQLGPRGSVPPYVSLPNMHASGGPSYLGASHAPFVVNADPNSPGFQVPDLVPPLDVPAERLDDRRKLYSAINKFAGSVEAQFNAKANALD
ncbi:MAG: hypothetical protein ACI9G1_003319, partial [Pirellulaceae bacterium]